LLLQTFFKTLPDDFEAPESSAADDRANAGAESVQVAAADEAVSATNDASDSNVSKADKVLKTGARVTAGPTKGCRWYIKEILLDHPMWKEARFWEQSLWQCVMEQVRTVKAN
jgi:hypothetical protein